LSDELPEQDFDRPTLFLVDGYALMYRAYYAMISRPLTTSSGENTSAPFGLTRFIIDLLEQHAPDYLGVVFDAGHSFREEVHPEYKATRRKMPEEMEASIPRCRALVEAFNIPVLEEENWEADDVIGTLAEQAEAEGLQTVIISGDKDFYQLIGPRVWLLNPGRGGASPVPEEWVRPENAEEKLGVPPERVTDYLALIGDSSDNVPGVAGIGEKTAPKLLDRWGSLEEILEHEEEVELTRARNALEDHEGDARLSKQLVTIRRDAPVELDLEALRRQEPDWERLRELFLELEFHSLAREYVPDDEGEGPAEGDEEYELVEAAGRVEELVERWREADLVAVDTETTSTNPMRADLVGVSVSDEAGRAWYLPFGHVSGAQDELFETVDVDENLPAITGPEMEPLRRLLADPDVPKVGHNIKYDLLVLEGAGVELRGIDFDTSVAAYCADPGRREYGLDVLVMEKLKRKLTPYDEVAGSGSDEISFAEVPVEEAVDYACEDADFTLRLAGVLGEELEQHDQVEIFDELEVPLIPVLAAMERAGIRLEEEVFERLEERITRELEQVEEEIAKVAGEEVNLRSVPQLRELLFEDLGLPVKKRTKTGPSTDESVLTELAEEGHEVPRLILDYRELDKLNSTYVSKLPEMVNPGTGRLHTSFNQTRAATGRLSSSDPNLQNIPIRSALGREVRKGFVPEEGWRFLAADYSQVELRVLAHLSGDEAFVTAFREGRDIHRETAARIFGVDPDRVQGAMREQAKTINYATIYGQGPGALGRQLGISRSRAEEFIEQYFERFSGVAEYLERMKETARDRGSNSPIQGTAADMIKIAMIRLHRRLPAGARMLLQVHDELVFEVREDAMATARQLVEEEMEGAMELDVPLEVEIGVGESWYAAKP